MINGWMERRQFKIKAKQYKRFRASKYMRTFDADKEWRTNQKRKAIFDESRRFRTERESINEQRKKN